MPPIYFASHEPNPRRAQVPRANHLLCLREPLHDRVPGCSCSGLFLRAMPADCTEHYRPARTLRQQPTAVRAVPSQPMTTDIFVFGSNLAGRHGAGSALEAIKKHGALRGQGWGIQGRSYAIPTKGWSMTTLPLHAIEHHVLEFIQFAKDHPEFKFNIVAIGCGLAGYTAKEIAPMFRDVPDNCLLPNEFLKALNCNQ